MTKVTELEKAVMMNIAQNEYNTANYGKPDSAKETCCWTDSIANCGGGPLPCPTGKILSGTLSSLNKKGLVISFSGVEGSAELTEDGFQVWKNFEEIK